jgi:glycerol-3-phosphate dehydrogenase (NAD(P)+)
VRVAVLGAGSWGTTVASLVCRTTGDVVIWARRPEVAEEITAQRSNDTYLPGLRLPRALKATADIEQAVSGVDVVIVGVPSQGFREALTHAAPLIRPWVPVVSLTKGFESETLRRMSQLIEELVPGHPAGALTGPNLAHEIMTGQAAAAVIAMGDDHVAIALQRLFQSGLFRVYTNDDVVGSEVGGALKNVVAIATGMAEGLEAGDNTRAMIITRGLAELTRLGVAMGGRAETFAGLAGMGDLVATCMSPFSRNRHVGEELGRGRKLDEILGEMKMVAEGVKTSSLVLDLARRYHVDLPICESIHSVVEGRSTPVDAYRGLLRRTPGHESQSD